MRILHGPVNIGNHPWVLSRHERALGIQSDLVVSYGTWLQYFADQVLGDAGKKSLRQLGRRFWFGVAAPFRYDVLHYYFGRTFHSWEDFSRPFPLRHLDLKLARWLQKKVFMTLQGCDVRLSDASERRNLITMCRFGHCSNVTSCRLHLDAQRRRLLETLLPYCDRVFVVNPELAHYVPGACFLPYANIDVEAFEPYWPRTKGRIFILHAPTDPGIKGTPLILQALENLKKRWPIDVLLVQKKPHPQALQLYAQADLVIDQLLAGWYGGFAVETMALGKPVACYLRDGDFDCLPPVMRRELPLCRVHPHTLEEDLERILEQRDHWPEWGERSRAFVLRWHHPRRIAQAMIQAYRHPHSHFFLDPDIEGMEGPTIPAKASAA